MFPSFPPLCLRQHPAGGLRESQERCRPDYPGSPGKRRAHPDGARATGAGQPGAAADGDHLAVCQSITHGSAVSRLGGWSPPSKAAASLLRDVKARPVFFKRLDGRRVTIHLHRPGQILPIGTLQEIIENEARWAVEDLRRLRLI
jgi:hypothetical protein